MKALRIFTIVTDFAFIIYWGFTIFHLLPVELAFKDYSNSIIISWNYSFLPLDLLVSFTGLYALKLLKRGNTSWRFFSIITLTLTLCSGLQAISFWVFKGDFDILWYAFNLYLILYPVPFLIKHFRGEFNE